MVYMIYLMFFLGCMLRTLANKDYTQDVVAKSLLGGFAIICFGIGGVFIVIEGAVLAYYVSDKDFWIEFLTANIISMLFVIFAYVFVQVRETRLNHIVVKDDSIVKTIPVEKDVNVSMLPFYAHETDAGMDIYANEDIIIAPGETKLIHTGLKMAIPEGYEIQVRPRSGLSLKTPLRICNAPGTIDAGYRDEIGIIMQNTSERFYTDGAGEIHVMPDCEKNHYTIDSKDNRKGWYDIKKGDRIAQIVLAQVPKMKLKVVDSVSSIEGNRGGGFGSTGTK